MDHKLIIFELQLLFFCAEDVLLDNENYFKELTDIILKYQKILCSLYRQHPEVFENLLYEGVNEIIDHFMLIDSGANIDCQKVSLEDVKLYLQQSILDTRKKVLSLPTL